jgi:hypothetical protein
MGAAFAGKAVIACNTNKPHGSTTPTPSRVFALNGRCSSQGRRCRPEPYTNRGRGYSSVQGAVLALWTAMLTKTILAGHNGDLRTVRFGSLAQVQQTAALRKGISLIPSLTLYASHQPSIYAWVA